MFLGVRNFRIRSHHRILHVYVIFVVIISYYYVRIHLKYFTANGKNYSQLNPSFDLVSKSKWFTQIFKCIFVNFQKLIEAGKLSSKIRFSFAFRRDYEMDIEMCWPEALHFFITLPYK